MNKDEALEIIAGQECVGGIWKGAWKVEDKICHGYLAATWFPYKRAGRFTDVKSAKAAVEAVTGKNATKC